MTSTGNSSAEEKIKLGNDPVIEYTMFPKGTFTNGKRVMSHISECFAMLSRFEYTGETLAEYRAGTRDQRNIWKNTGGVVMGTFTGNYRNGENYLSGCAAMLDIEKIAEHTGFRITQAELDAKIKAKLPYCVCCYSSHSDTDADPRRRVCIMLSRLATKAEMALVTREIARRLNIEWVDPKSYDPQQLMYLPSCSKDATPVFWYQDGPAFDVDEVLQGYTLLYGDWHETKNWPKPSFESYVSPDRKLTDPKDKPGWIGAYNRVFDIQRVLDEEIPCIYEETISPGRLRYSNGVGAPGAKICDDYGPGTFLCSFHSDDPANGVHNAFDLVRIHKFGNLDAGIADDMPMQNRPSHKAMIDYVQTIPAVVDEWSQVSAVGASEFVGLNPTEVRISLYNMLKEIHPEKNERYGWHDAGNGNLFSDLSRDIARFVPERKKWYVYDSTRWAPDIGSTRTMNFCKTVADTLMSYTIQNISDEKLRADYIKHISKWQGYKYRETILKDAGTVAPLSLSEFDRNKFLFNCKNGTLDLHSGEFKEHDCNDLITKLANVEYNPDAVCGRWEQFISEIMCGDAELSVYLQKALGYALTGDTKHECFFILYGATSRNGKGTLTDTFGTMVGDYGRTASPETIAQRKYSDSRSPSEDIARLAGARYVNISEPDKKMILSASLVKTLTGNDSVTARFLGENSFEYKPQFKMFINTNHLPYATDSTLFSSDRVKVIPFNKHFGAGERDEMLKHKLTRPESLSGILNWCIAGLRALSAEGFGVPQSVREATQDYNENSDKVGQFISDCLIPSAQGEAFANIVHKAYQDWCWANGFKPEGYSEFRKSLASAGIEVKRARPKNANKHNGNKEQLILGYELQNA